MMCFSASNERRFPSFYTISYRRQHPTRCEHAHRVVVTVQTLTPCSATRGLRKESPFHSSSSKWWYFLVEILALAFLVIETACLSKTGFTLTLVLPYPYIAKLGSSPSLL